MLLFLFKNLFKRKLNYFDIIMWYILFNLFPWYLALIFSVLAICISLMGEDALAKLEKEELK
jgi:hypothetical protein